MISIVYSQIPAFLYNSAFYQSLCGEDEENFNTIQIPERCFKESDMVASVEDFGNLLHTMQFWGVDAIPDGMIEYLHGSDIFDWKSVAENILDPNSPPLRDLFYIFNTSKNNQCYAEITFERAIKRGRKELLEYWLSCSAYLDQLVCSARMTAVAAEHGQLQCLEVLLNNKFVCLASTAHSAAAGGHLDCLRILHENGCEWNTEVYTSAAANGHLHIMKYAYEQGLKWSVEVCNVAGIYGHLECLRFAHEHGCPWTDEVVRYAASNGHYDCLMYALEHGCTAAINAANCAASYDHLDCLQLLHAHHAPWGESTCMYAAKFGHLHILRYLHENNCPWDISLHAEAAQDGHLHCIQYAYSQGLEWSTSTYVCDRAAEYGQVEVLRYLHENGAPWDCSTVYKAVRKGFVDVVQYAIEHGCDWSRNSATERSIVNVTGGITMLKYLLSQWQDCGQSDLHRLAEFAAYNGNLDILQYLVQELHCVLSSEDNSVFTAALSGGNLRCVQYCFERGCRQISDGTLSKYRFLDGSDVAILRCLQYLVQHGWEIPRSFAQRLENGRFPFCVNYKHAVQKTILTGREKRKLNA